MKKDGFFAEVMRAIVAHHKKRAREGKFDYYFNQKKQLWYAMMAVVDAEEDAKAEQEAKAALAAKDAETTGAE